MSTFFFAGRSRRSERGGIILTLLAWLMVLALLATVWLLRRPLLRTAGELLVVDEGPQPSDAIVVLGNDNYFGDRAARAAELYRGRWAPRVIASGAQVRPYASIADLMRRDLIERGVPQDAAIHFSHRAAGTREEAYAVRELLRRNKWTRLIVVTSNYHTRRARYIYRRALDPGMEVRVVSANDSLFDVRNWWESREGLKTFARECAAWILALVEMQQAEPNPAKLLLPSPEPAPAPAR